jgi:hypothetical protein
VFGNLREHLQTDETFTHEAVACMHTLASTHGTFGNSRIDETFTCETDACMHTLVIPNLVNDHSIMCQRHSFQSAKALRGGSQG